jgi:hypothetical protein
MSAVGIPTKPFGQRPPNSGLPPIRTGFSGGDGNDEGDDFWLTSNIETLARFISSRSSGSRDASEGQAAMFLRLIRQRRKMLEEARHRLGIQELTDWPFREWTRMVSPRSQHIQQLEETLDQLEHFVQGENLFSQVVSRARQREMRWEDPDGPDRAPEVPDEPESGPGGPPFV